MINNQNDESNQPFTGEENRMQADELPPRADIPLGNPGILPVGGMLSAVPGSLMGEGGGYGSPLGGAGLYPIIAPMGEMADAEQEIASAVEAAIAEDGRVSAAALSTIRISASVHTVLLEGTVPSESEKREAGDIAAHAPGVRSVENRLTVSS